MSHQATLPGRHRHLTWLEELLKNLHRHLRCVEHVELFEPKKWWSPTRSGWGVGDETVSNFSKPLGWKMPISFDDFANQFLFGFGRGLQLLKVSYMLGVICQTMWSFDTMARCWPRTLKFPYHGSLCDELRGQLGSSNSYHWTLLEYFLPHSCRRLVAIATGSFPSVQKSPTRVVVTSAVRG